MKGEIPRQELLLSTTMHHNFRKAAPGASGIRNLIFDLGDVLIEWNPNEAAALGMTAKDTEELLNILVQAVKTHDAQLGACVISTQGRVFDHAGRQCI